MLLLEHGLQQAEKENRSDPKDGGERCEWQHPRPGVGYRFTQLPAQPVTVIRSALFAGERQDVRCKFALAV